MTRKQRILRRLMDAMIHCERIEYPERSGHYLPVGEIPMPFFQGPEYGGSAANVRLSELRMPEQASKQYSGIPILKNVIGFMHDGELHRVVTYRLGITKPENIEAFIDFEHCRLNREAIDRAGGVIVEYDDDADGKDKSGKTVKIITRAEYNQRRAERSLHPLAPQLPT